MGTCGRRFRRALFMKSSIIQRHRRMYIKNCFAWLAFERHFHFGSDTLSEYNDVKLILDENERSIIT